MIEHVVLFKWNADATPEAIDAVVTGLRNMKGRIPGVVDLSCGENFCARSQGFTHGLVVRLTDRAALDAYADHPVHTEVIRTLINPIRADVLALDYEI